MAIREALRGEEQGGEAMEKLIRRITREVTSEVTLRKLRPNGVWVLVDGTVVVSLQDNTIKIWDSNLPQAGFDKIAFTSNDGTIVKPITLDLPFWSI
jgi:hypothetical protein